MRSWLTYTVLVIIALVALLVLESTPATSTWITFVGTPVVVLGAALGAKWVQKHNSAVQGSAE